MKIPLPTNAKMTALVWSGRNRPNVVGAKSKFKKGHTSCNAMISPTNIPTAPQSAVAIANCFTILLS